MEREPTDDAIAAWVRLNRAQRFVLAAVERALKAQGLPPLGWYDVLLELSRAGGPLRPVELEGRLLLAQHNVSRLLERMEAAGLVARTRHALDGRGQDVRLTDAGHGMRQRMWAVYGPAISIHVGGPLGGGATELAGLLDRLLAGPN